MIRAGMITSWFSTIIIYDIGLLKVWHGNWYIQKRKLIRILPHGFFSSLCLKILFDNQKLQMIIVFARRLNNKWKLNCGDLLVHYTIWFRTLHCNPFNISSMTDTKIFRFPTDFHLPFCSNLCILFHFQPNWGNFNKISPLFLAFFLTFSTIFTASQFHDWH